MKKLLLLLFLFSTSIHAQQEAFIIQNTFGGEKLDPKGTFVVTDDTTGNFAVFMIAKEYTYGFLYDQDFNLLKEIKSTRLPYKFTSFQGYVVQNNNYTFLMNTSNNKKYGVVIFNFETGFYSAYETDFKLKDERLLFTTSHLGTCYLATISKEEDQLLIYSFKDKWNEPVVRVINFDDQYFKENKRKTQTIRSIFFNKLNLQSIENSIPISIKEASAKIKLYRKGTEVTIISNKYSEKTFALNFNLIEGGVTFTSFDMPEFERKGFVAKSNSFLLDGKLFQVRANTNKLAFNIINITNNKEVKRFEADKGVPIDFKNGSIIQKNMGSNSYQKNIRTTSAFLRKLQVMDIGVSAYKENDNYIFSIGGYREEKSSAIFIVPGVGFIGGAIAGAASSFLSYKHSKAVFIEGLLDKNLEHQLGTIDVSWYDIVHSFSKNKKNKAETLFKKNNIYYWGNYSYKKDTYSFYSFGN